MLTTHICFRRALKVQGIDPKSLPFSAPLAPYLQWAAILATFFIMGCEFYLALFGDGTPTAKGFFSVYLAVPLFLFDYIAYKVRCGSFQSLEQLVFVFLPFPPHPFWNTEMGIANVVLNKHSCTSRRNGSSRPKSTSPRRSRSTKRRRQSERLNSPVARAKSPRGSVIRSRP